MKRPPPVPPPPVQGAHPDHAASAPSYAKESQGPADAAGSRVIQPDVPEATLEALRNALTPPRPEERERRLRDLAAAARRERRIRDAALHMLIADLCGQGWSVQVSPPEITLAPPPSTPGTGETPQDVKQRHRQALLAARAAQLADPNVRAFLRGMEQRRLHQGRRCSVLDVIDNGADLVEALSRALSVPASQRAEALAAVIDPVVEIADSESRCGETGLGLLEIWRYLRHTWSLEYRSTPGRTLLLLIRNRARPGRPVMGIAALASALPQLRLREEWVGWTPAALERRLALRPETWAAEHAVLLRTVDEALASTRSDDLLAGAEGQAGQALEQHLLALSVRAERRRQAEHQTRHEAAERGEEVDPLSRRATQPGRAVDWKAASEESLFVRKRAKLLADLFFARRVLTATETTAEAASRGVTRSSEVARAVRLALREVRKAGLSSRLLDINVCGAVPPYGPLLAGKLAALAVTSSEVAQAYAVRYSLQISEIASRMAGREITRPADLCALTTTSLYGVASSQYNRLHLEVEVDGKPTQLRWQDLGLTEGFGTAHLGESLVQVLREVATEHKAARLINNVFGEGNSPRLRQIRAGLEALGIPGDAVLQHSAQRRVYAVELSPEGCEALRRNVPHTGQLLPLAGISAAWRNRWLHMRAANPTVLAEVRAQGSHTVRERLADTQAAQLELL